MTEDNEIGIGLDLVPFLLFEATTSTCTIIETIRLTSNNVHVDILISKIVILRTRPYESDLKSQTIDDFLEGLNQSVKKDQIKQMSQNTNIYSFSANGVLDAHTNEAEDENREFDESPLFSEEQKQPQQNEMKMNENTPLVIDEHTKSTNGNGFHTYSSSESDAVSAHDFYFENRNSSIRKYYRFTSSSLTPFAALMRKPDINDGPNQGVTGLLRRSAGKVYIHGK